MRMPHIPPLDRVLVVEEIDSTNEEARRAAESGDAGNLWILARTQTAGRGRRGRDWVSPRGNFHGSLLLRPNVSPARAAMLSFAAANAVAESFEALGARAVQVKWPNDVLIGGAKAAGILLESSARNAAAVDWLIIGIGMNLNEAPKGTPYPATSLKEQTGRSALPEDALAIVAGAFAAQYERWQREGFAPVRADWLTRAAFLGERIVARLENESVEGVFADLSEDGALLLDTALGRRSITAGEVFRARID